MNRVGLRGGKKFQEMLAGNTKSSQEAMRDYYLNPFGLKVSSSNKTTMTSAIPKERRHIDFLNWKLNFKKPQNEVEPNVLTVVTEMKATKPEIKQYIEKVYGLNVLRVNTLIQMGKLKTGANRSNLLITQERYRESDFKKAYVTLTQKVPGEFAYKKKPKGEAQ